MNTDYHIHTASTDGPAFEEVRVAARQNGLEEIGFVDHCNVSPYNNIGYEGVMFDDEEAGLEDSPGYFNEHAGLREEAFEEFIRDHDNLYSPGQVLSPIQISDGLEPVAADGGKIWLDSSNADPLVVWRGVEMDYEPDSERFIDDYLGIHNFDYSIGSIHYLDDTYVPKEGGFPEMSSRAAEENTEIYFDKMVSLVESELFDVLAHPGLIERNPIFEPHVTRGHYAEVADALKSSSTVTEFNGKSFERQDSPYPVEVMHDRGVDHFTVGTDTHRPDEIGERAPLIDEQLEHMDITPLSMGDVLSRQDAERLIKARAV